MIGLLARLGEVRPQLEEAEPALLRSKAHA